MVRKEWKKRKRKEMILTRSYCGQLWRMKMQKFVEVLKLKLPWKTSNKVFLGIINNYKRIVYSLKK